jgi:hypothetical protein
LLRDKQSSGSSEIALKNAWINLQSSEKNQRKESGHYVQLALKL